MHEVLKSHFLIYLSYTNPCPITPSFDSFPIYGTPLGLVSLWHSFPLALLARSFLTGSFFFPRYFSDSIPSWLEEISSVPGFSEATEYFLLFSAFLDFFLWFWEAVWQTQLPHNHWLVFLYVTAGDVSSTKDLLEGRILCGNFKENSGGHRQSGGENSAF